MNTETIEYKCYKIKIAQDEGPENPFEAWDCNPPLLAFYAGRHENLTAYNAPETIGQICDMLPDSLFSRGQRVPLIREYLNCSLKDFAEAHRDNRSWSEPGSIAETRETFARLAEEQVGAKPHGWRDALEWFEMAECLLTYAGIPCLNVQSNGYCQGDSTLLLAIATPAFLAESGVLPENAAACLKSATDLYSAWAWGDVYGVSEITAPGPLDEDGDETEGEELEHGSCWSFYGRDHEKSGLMEHATSTIDCHIEEQAKEAHDLESALCSAE